jgi:DNA adenine methylase
MVIKLNNVSIRKIRYLGGKAVVGKRISEIIFNLLDPKDHDPDNLKNTIYIEPFCGACGLMRYMSKHFLKCYANDICKDVIMLLKAVKGNTFENPKITKEKWLQLKYTNKSSAERAFAGFGCSFGGVFFNGYINNSDNNDMEYSSLMRITDKLQNIKFSNMDYITFIKSFKFESTKKYVIYLDPPYKNTSCQPWPEFDSIQFWNIVRKLGKMKNIKIFISEVSAPNDLKCIYKFKRTNGMHNITSSKTIIEEKLYTI